MSGELRFEETVPEHYIVYKPTKARGHGPSYLSVRPFATVEKRCGKWLWWLRDESDIGLCDTYEGAKAVVTGLFGERGEEVFVPPTPEQAREVAEAYCKSRHVDPALFDADEFIAFYEARGWTAHGGHRRMKSWRTAVRSWVKRVAGL